MTTQETELILEVNGKIDSVWGTLSSALLRGIWPQCRRVEDMGTSTLGVGQDRTAELPRRFEGKGLSGAGKGQGCST